MEQSERTPSLHQPAAYEIKVPGQLDEGWADWLGEMTVAVDTQDHGLPVTTLTGALDQAALQGLLRRLYALGLPLISVICLECGSDYGNCSCRQ
jgi:hypothetical protein